MVIIVQKMELVVVETKLRSDASIAWLTVITLPSVESLSEIKNSFWSQMWLKPRMMNPHF